ncbi:G-protein alpha subunit-domain-containing protein [Nemania sp. NC0429]|nr:G-protein alpha subunit-domain-containing protein [Nemania sp. NC0429]
MDPVTIVQIVGTVVSLTDVVLKCVTRLSALKARYHDAPIIITSMVGQLHIVRIAQEQLSPLISRNFGHDPRYRQLASQIGNALDSFGPILLALSQHLDQYEDSSADQMTSRRRMGFVRSEKEMTNLSILLDRQVNALNLLLQAIQCQTWAQQSDVISEMESQSILRLAQDCSSSIVGLEDVASFISENTAAISTQFEFDDILRTTLLYQAAERSHLRQAIRAKNPKDPDKASMKSAIGKPSTFGFKQAFQAIRPSIKTVVSGNLSVWQGTRVKIRRDLVLEPSEKNVTAERGSLQTISSRHTDGESGESSLGPAPGTPTQPLLSRADSGSSQLQTAHTGWRRGIRKRSPNAHETGEDRMIKVLLLGASGGGKSTLLNAMKIFTEAQEPRDDESRLRALVWHNALDSVATILRGAEQLGIAEAITKATTGAQELLNPCSDCERDPAWNPGHTVEVARTIVSLRTNTTFQEAVRCKSTYQFHDNGQYYIDNIVRLAEQAVHRSAPTNGDLLRTRVTTTGIHQSVLSYNDTRFCVFDVGGERSERKKWIHAFPGVSAVIFPVDTTGYRRSRREVPDSDRMVDQIAVFESLANSPWFVQTIFIVVFTKIDLLEDYMRGEDVDAFLRDASIVTDSQPRVTAATVYLNYLERHFLRLVKAADARDRIRFVRATLVDVDSYNPAADIFDTLESFA